MAFFDRNGSFKMLKILNYPNFIKLFDEKKISKKEVIGLLKSIDNKISILNKARRKDIEIMNTTDDKLGEFTSLKTILKTFDDSISELKEIKKDLIDIII